MAMRTHAARLLTLAAVASAFWLSACGGVDGSGEAAPGPADADAGDTGVAVSVDGYPLPPVDPGLTDADADDADAAPSPATLAQHRDRLLDTLPGGRCEAWAALDGDQRAVFLLVTDLLGKRTVLDDADHALSHVRRVHALRGRQHEGCLRCCGDREHNRVYLSLDDTLIAAFRDGALPAWRDTRDLLGPHEPFTASSETDLGQPRGQAHFFAADADVVALGRPGVEGVFDPRALELDLDFNLLHESAPTCEYGGESGLLRYQELWGAQGAAGDAELGFAPEGC
ncbi:MAG: hypothetical protein A2138_16615 [Deltaproteobacteria bacterium RBG_16_71_12]|nr:MAG: hypothetical protein A2138_16615 [Deltaproteobacteria bacterium RBG_16_71_12]